MEHHSVGSLSISRVGLGSGSFGMKVDEDNASAIIHAAFDQGVNFIDTADMYGATLAEEFIGKAIAGRRDEFVISTKCGYDPVGGIENTGFRGLSAGWIAEAAEGSLRRLGTDYIDLYQPHAPDPDVPIEETLGALNELVVAGKVREIGTSRYSAAEVVEADEAARALGTARFVSIQTGLSLLQPDALAELGPACAEHDVTIMTFSPQTFGILAGKFRRPANAAPGEEPEKNPSLAMIEQWFRPLFDKGAEVVEPLAAFAEARGHSVAQLSVAWVLAQPYVSGVIVGASNLDQVAQNIAAGEWKLDEAELAEIWEIVAPRNEGEKRNEQEGS